MTGQSASGQQTPDDSGSELQGTMALCERMIARLDTMKLVKVIAVHSNGEVAAAGTVDVQPLVSQIDFYGTAVPHGTVYGIPWWRLQGGPNAVICDPVVGDIGYVMAADRDTSKVRNTKAVAAPGSRRRYSISDGIYVGGCLNAVPTAYVLFTADGHLKLVDIDGNSVVTAAGGITITDKTGNVIQTSSTGIAMTPFGGQPVTVNGALVVTGNLQLGGTVESQAGGLYGGSIHTSGTITGDTDVVAAGKSGAHHTHGGVQTGGGTSGPPS